MKIVITGAAGLVGQNLIARMAEQPDISIVGIDKNSANIAVLRKLHPGIQAIEADLASSSIWQGELEGASALVIGHAQIGGLDREEFVRNNVQATRALLAAAVAANIPYVVHISSSVVNSSAVDYYTETKKDQEKLVAASGLKQIVLRPTLMFGWFDRKHLGWLARFMQRTPVFPIPGSGLYRRQALYVGDFCNVILSALRDEKTGAYNISGLEVINYIDLIRAVKEASGGTARVVNIPYQAFRFLLWLYGTVSSNPPFTTSQLRALVIPEIFEMIDWPGLFGVKATPLRAALTQTFQDPVYSKIVLEF